MKTKEKGNLAEKKALAFLKKQGLKLVARNYQIRQGEIDLIMTDGKTLAFIEVRYRADNAFGGAAASVDSRKQQKIIQTANHYLQTNPNNAACRFDVIAIDSTGKINWIRQAFEAN